MECFVCSVAFGPRSPRIAVCARLKISNWGVYLYSLTRPEKDVRYSVHLQSTVRTFPAYGHRMGVKVGSRCWELESESSQVKGSGSWKVGPYK